MATPAPPVDAAPATLNKVVLTYQNQGDTRHIVAYTDATGDADTSATGNGPEALATKLLAYMSGNCTYVAGVVEHPDGTTRNLATPAAGSAGPVGTAALASAMAWKLQLKDSRGRVGGHWIHCVNVGPLSEASQTGIAPATVGAPLVAIATVLTSGHWYTKSGYKYLSVFNARLSWRRDKASGGGGRKLTVHRAEKFLARRGITAIPNPVP